MAPRNMQRQGYVKTLRQIGRACGLRTVPGDSNVGQARVRELLRSILSVAGLTEEQRAEAVAAEHGYAATFHPPLGGAAATTAPEPEGHAQEQDPCAWQFKAAQFTYNHTTGEWASADKSVLAGLWDRFKVFGKALATEWGALGVTMTMERSKQSDLHVHMHLYLHMETQFRRRGRDALDNFAFEGIRPHVSPNTASGSAYKGAVDYGHFYVWVQKIGSADSWGRL